MCNASSYSVLPGFGLTMGLTLVYLSLLVLIPLSGLFIRSASADFGEVWAKITDPRVLASYRLSFGASLLAAAINGVFGFVVAWSLVRYRFPGRRLVDALVDLPFALPTAVSGIALATIMGGNGWVGSLLEPLGLKIAFTRIGVVVALTLVGLPFVVRTLQPALEDLESELEEAAATLGAGRLTTFRRVLFPSAAARARHRVRARLRARGGRVRLGGVHRRQPADEDRDRAAPDRDQARAVRLPRRHRDRRRHARPLLRAAADHQPAPGLGARPHGGRSLLMAGTASTLRSSAVPARRCAAGAARAGAGSLRS